MLTMAAITVDANTLILVTETKSIKFLLIMVVIQTHVMTKYQRISIKINGME
jgi:hypothetical protein